MKLVVFSNIPLNISQTLQNYISDLKKTGFKITIPEQCYLMSTLDFDL